LVADLEHEGQYFPIVCLESTVPENALDILELLELAFPSYERKISAKFFWKEDCSGSGVRKVFLTQIYKRTADSGGIELVVGRSGGQGWDGSRVNRCLTHDYKALSRNLVKSIAKREGYIAEK
jgi:hypothetical protein